MFSKPEITVSPESHQFFQKWEFPEMLQCYLGNVSLCFKDCASECRSPYRGQAGTSQQLGSARGKCKMPASPFPAARCIPPAQAGSFQSKAILLVLYLALKLRP